MIDPEEYVAGPAKELLESAGREITLINQTVATDADGNVIRDDYRDPEIDETTVTTRGEIVVRGTPEFEARAGSSDVDVTAFVWVADDHAGDLNTGSESESRTKIRINDDVTELEAEVLEVIRVTDENNGKLRLQTVGA